MKVIRFFRMAKRLGLMVLLALPAWAGSGCRGGDGETAPSPEPEAKAPSSPGIIDTMTGRTMIDAGERAKAVIKETSQERQRQLDEALGE